MLAKKSFSADSSLSESLSEAEPQKFVLTESASPYSNTSQPHSNTLNDDSLEVKSHSSLFFGLGQRL
jgi:hypothetical protein